MIDIDIIPKICGIYYLYENEKLCYIGKSVNINTRLKAHKKHSLEIKKYVNYIDSHDIIFLKNHQDKFQESHRWISEAQKIHYIFDKLTEIKTIQVDRKILTVFERNEINKMMPLCNDGLIKHDFCLSILEKLDIVSWYYLQEVW